MIFNNHRVTSAETQPEGGTDPRLLHLMQMDCLPRLLEISEGLYSAAGPRPPPAATAAGSIVGAVSRPPPVFESCSILIAIRPH